MVTTREKILVVEDEKDISQLIRTALGKQKFRVTCAGDGRTGLRLARELKPDLIILDVMLPKLDGLEVLRTLRPESKAPIMMLTAKGGEVDRILGLRLGADDYIVKPFSVNELQARVERHLQRAAAVPRPAPERRPICIGQMSLAFDRHEILVRGERVHLAPKEFAILKALVEADGKVLSREGLLQLIWGDDPGLDMDLRVIDQHVARLRRKLKSEGQRILTVTNAGYRIQR